ncbi:hypothetical protein C8N40_111211 [Pontibacter mucosus]|uniref:Uncharacterized protein n=1 Tax=Pontibacter mucosus TaxID=1649266 RepID=A0A2T5YDG9_9BACT|nr:hypothetical protein C8N40_111211 [Pontibacter mucosus]
MRICNEFAIKPTPNPSKEGNSCDMAGSSVAHK